MFLAESLACDCCLIIVCLVDFRPVAKRPILIQRGRYMCDDAIQPETNQYLVLFSIRQSGAIDLTIVNYLFILHTRLQMIRYGNCLSNMHGNMSERMHRIDDSSALQLDHFEPSCIFSRFQPMIRAGTGAPYLDDRSGTLSLFYSVAYRFSFSLNSMNYQWINRFLSLQPRSLYVCHCDSGAICKNLLFRLIDRPSWEWRKIDKLKM